MAELANSVSLFLRERRYSPRTVEAYVFWARRLEAHFPDREATKLSPTDMILFFQHLRSRHTHNETISQATSALRFVTREVLRRSDLYDVIPRMKQSRQIASIPTQREVMAAIDRMKNQQMRLAAKCIYGMGLELQDARRMKVKDIDFSLNRARVSYRRSKVPRYTPLPLFAIEDLRVRCNEAGSDDYLFSLTPGKPVDDTTIQRAWAYGRDAAKLSRKHNIRSLRHAYIHHLELLGISLVDILNHLGINKRHSMEYYSAYGVAGSEVTFSPADRRIYEEAEGSRNALSPYVAESRIAEVAALPSSTFDFSRLVALLQELNSASDNGNLITVAFLARAVIDHVPPVFGFHTFAEVVSNYGGTKSFKKSMEHLNMSLRNIADGYLHVPIRSKEDLPQPTQVDFRAALDQLLGEIARLLKRKAT